MNTTDTTLLIILTSLLSILLLIFIATMVVIFKLVRSVQKVVIKAEDVIESVETAADNFKQASSHATTIKVIKNIFKLANKRRK